jgi:hypothetical protein
MDLGGYCPDATPPDVGLLMREMELRGLRDFSPDGGDATAESLVRTREAISPYATITSLLDAPARNCSVLLFALSICIWC